MKCMMNDCGSHQHVVPYALDDALENETALEGVAMLGGGSES